MAKRRDHDGMSRDREASIRRAENCGLSARSIREAKARLDLEIGQTVVCHETGRIESARWVGVVTGQREKTMQYTVDVRWHPNGRPMGRPAKVTFSYCGHHQGTAAGVPGMHLSISPMVSP